jgi:hypothetical protein
MKPYSGPERKPAPARNREGFAGAPYQTVRRATSRCNDVDVHELLKGEIYAQNTANDGDYVLQQASAARSTDDNVQPTPSEVRALIGFEDTGIYLDSIGKSSALSSVDNGTLAYSINTLNNNVELRNVISMRIDPFYLPRMTNPRVNLAPTPPAYPTFVPNAPDLFFYRRVYLQVLTLPSTQSVNGLGSTQFQWELEVSDLNSLAVLCTPLRPVFYLPRPLLSLSEIQFRFMVPSPTGMRPITLFNETRTVQMIPGTNPARFFINSAAGQGILNTYIPPFPPSATIATVLPPNPPAIVAPGVAVQMTGFVGVQPATANTTVQDLVNNAGGLFITSIQYESVGAPFFQPAQNICTFTIADINGSPVTTFATTLGVNAPTLPASVINVVSTAGFPSSGVIQITVSTPIASIQTITYLGLTATSFTGCSGGTGVLTPGNNVTYVPPPNTMIIMQQRIAMPMYFTCVRDQLTNHIAITHP